MYSFVVTTTFGQLTQLSIVYIVSNTLGSLLTLNAILYCVFRILNVFFFCLAFKQPSRNQQNFWKTYENLYTFFSFAQFDSTKPTHTFEKHEKNLYKYGTVPRIFTWKLLATSIHCCIGVQQYTYTTTACVNWPIDL